MTARKGFTLIELLIVIAVLGVIAAGVVVAINPAKRIKQANDAKIRNDVGQIATAMQAFYTANQYYPATVALLSGASGSGDLKVEPKVPPTGTAVYSVSRTADPACTTSPYTGCEVAVFATLNDVVTDAEEWCWKSSTGTAAAVATGACTP